MNSYKSILVNFDQQTVTITLNRPDIGNGINKILLTELFEVFNNIESNPSIKVVILEGQTSIFCNGMDFQQIANIEESSALNDDMDMYYELLKKMATCSKVIITKIEGKVNAGGIGFVAVSDIAVAGENALFSLSEMLFGLIPACVLPFLIRRIGHQKAQWMTLVSHEIKAKRAYEIGLVDELNTNVDTYIKRLLIRLTKLEMETISELKKYMWKLWIIDDQTQKIAVNKIKGLINSEQVQNNITQFVNSGKLPWDK